jgi:hypothetical protein
VWHVLMWLWAGWAAKGAWDTFQSKVAAEDKRRGAEYAEAFQSGIDSDDVAGVQNLADAFEQRGEPVYATKLRAHVAELLASQTHMAAATPVTRVRAPAHDELSSSSVEGG